MFRGYRNLKALIGHLNHNKGLSKATDVILTGCSGTYEYVYIHTKCTLLLTCWEESEWVLLAPACMHTCSWWTGSLPPCWLHPDSDRGYGKVQGISWCRVGKILYTPFTHTASGVITSFSRPPYRYFLDIPSTTGSNAFPDSFTSRKHSQSWRPW